MHTFLFCLTVIICIVLASSWQADSTEPIGLEMERAKVERTEKPKQEKISRSLAQIAKATLVNHFQVESAIAENKSNIEEFAEQFLVSEDSKSANGVFVTFSRDGKTRACWGSIHPKYPNLILATIYATEDALQKEYRHKPIQKSEVNQLDSQVTVVKSVVPVQSLASINPLHDGLMVKANGKGAVILPGETCDNHMQLVMAKLKANIKSNQSCQLYRIETDVYR